MVSKRTMTWSFSGLPAGAKTSGPASGSITSWTLNPITFDEETGNLVPNLHYDNHKGGPRQMQNAVAITYFSVLNLATNYCKGKVTVDISYSLYSGQPGQNITGQFKEAAPPQGLADGIGWDEYVHAPWRNSAPNLQNAKLLQGGEQIDAVVTWDRPNSTFTSTNTNIRGGPQRAGRGPGFPDWWEFDPNKKSWVQKGNGQ